MLAQNAPQTVGGEFIMLPRYSSPLGTLAGLWVCGPKEGGGEDETGKR